jgi:hypothetical protein
VSYYGFIHHRRNFGGKIGIRELRPGASAPMIRAARLGEATMALKSSSTGEVIIEMRPVGSVVRVAAVDVATGTEVIVMGPAASPPKALEELAVAKLRRKLSSDRG